MMKVYDFIRISVNISKRQPGRELVCSRKYKENHKTLQHLKIADKINESHE